jgi:type II secretory pathway component PulK
MRRKPQIISSRSCATGVDRASRPATRSRRGFVTVAAIVGLVVLSIVLATVVQVAVVGARQTRVEQAAWQAEFLALAGADFARAALRRDENWKEATWNVPAETLGRPGSITARLQTTDSGRELEIHATFPTGDPHAVTRRLTLPL